ncbi:hypothetical protein SBA1_160011 [Candidatus Sulfotelmatobacter kueseliae]|uniref:Uncharacterized protein n=1 Tax=Candidatus Sulfotelmatobacter kueseliae TaxID=2042962 RepID=A0A2U3KAE2_9BACT|nr:hypothetical protein SBA1_160011 [Candidatus Sulfotelmatobacter kueseliae]
MNAKHESRALRQVNAKTPSVCSWGRELSLLGGTELYEAIQGLLRLSGSPSERLSEGWTPAALGKIL